MDTRIGLSESLIAWQHLAEDRLAGVEMWKARAARCEAALRAIADDADTNIEAAVYAKNTLVSLWEQPAMSLMLDPSPTTDKEAIERAEMQSMSKRAAMPKWVEVAYWTWRLPAPGGWLYRYGITRAEGMVFVPDSNREE